MWCPLQLTRRSLTTKNMANECHKHILLSKYCFCEDLYKNLDYECNFCEFLLNIAFAFIFIQVT